MLMLLAPRQTTTPDVDVAVENDFDFGSAAYKSLWNPERATAFQAPLWLDMIHRRLAPAVGARQHTITLRDRKGGGLVGVLPMVMQKANGVRMLQPADFGVCDYNSVVGNRLRLTALAAEGNLRRALRKAASGADVVMFRKVREDDFDPAILFGRMASSDGENAAYECRTGLDADEFRLKILRRKFTKELGRLQRQTERENGAYEHRIVTRPDEIRRAFDFLRQAHVERHKDSVLSREIFFDFYLDYALAGAASDQARTWVSTVDGKIVAALFGPSGDGILHAVLIGTDSGEFERISPGMQLLYRIMHAQIAQGCDRLDLGLGDSGYKSHFRPHETRIVNHSMSLTPAGSAVGLIYHHSKGLKNLLKGLAPHVR